MSVEQFVPQRLRWSSRLRPPQVPVAAFVVDVVVILLSVLAALLIRSSWGLFHQDHGVADRVGVLGVPMMVCWVAAIWVNDGYHRSVLEVGADEFRKVALASMFTLGLMCAGCFLLKFPLSRGFLFLSFAVGAPGLLLGRSLVRLLLRKARDKGMLRHHVLIAGSADSVDDIARVLRREPRLGFSLVGALVSTDSDSFETRTGIPVLGGTQDICSAAIASGVDTLFLASGAVSSSDEMRTLVWDLEDYEIQVVVAPNLSEISGDRVRIRPVGGLPLVHIERPRVQHAVRWGKRCFDVVASSLILIAASPLLLLASIQVWFHDRGPVLFRQTRVGRDGVEFSCLKFRTMVADAEALLQKLHTEQGFNGGLFKMKSDPRITPPGRWLRKFSVDELPQLVNVLRGEMSLVGPRPPLPREVAEYLPHAHRRLRVRPGLTGLWQVSGRSELTFDEAIRLDLYYVDNWSVFQDVSILFRTFSAVARSRGAC